jgi:hypothetical protein
MHARPGTHYIVPLQVLDSRKFVVAVLFTPVLVCQSTATVKNDAKLDKSMTICNAYSERFQVHANEPHGQPANVSLRIAALIETLSSEAYQERETAEKDLETLGEPAIEQLRIACKSPNPEVSRRAQDVLRRIERKLANEKALTPTMVALNFKQITLSEGLDELSRQSNYKIALARSDDEPALAVHTRLTLNTGKVPFFEALRQICSAGDLEIHSIGGLTGSGSFKAPSSSNTSIILAPRGKNPKRPVSVYGAVLVEAITMPKESADENSTSTVLQVWPEPKLNWLATASVSNYKAKDDLGQLLRTNTKASLQPPQFVNGKNVLAKPSASHLPSFAPNTRQTVLSLKPSDWPSGSLKELTGAIHGIVRTETKVLIGFTKMKSGVTYEGMHVSGASLKAMIGKAPNGQWYSEVSLSFSNSIEVDSSSFKGLKVSDAVGNRLFFLPRFNSMPLRGITEEWRFSLLNIRGSRSEQGEPDSITFCGTFPMPVVVPFELKDVPLSGGRK